MEFHIETIDQLIEFIHSLSNEEYQFVATPWFESSIGQHLRHIVDLYQALMFNRNEQQIDYDIRRRGAPIESQRKVGLCELNEIKDWLNELDDTLIHQSIQIKTEISLLSQQSMVFDSSFGRELCFASSHLIHHLAIMAAIAKMTGKKVDGYLGMAPATASHSRTLKRQVYAVS
jgi:hypothetical protein